MASEQHLYARLAKEGTGNLSPSPRLPSRPKYLIADIVSDCAPGQLGAPLAMAVAQRLSTVGATKKFGTRFGAKKPAPKKATGGFQTKGWGLPGARDEINLAAWYGTCRPHV